MDLAKLDATIMAEEGVDMVLRHPVTNEQLDIIVTLRGTESVKVKAALERYLKISEDSKKSAKEVQEYMNKVLLVSIIDIKNAEYDGKPITNSDQDIRFFIERFGWAATQVISFIGNIENFLPQDNS